MKNRKMKSFVIPGIYAFAIVAFIVGVVLIEKVINMSSPTEEDDNNYVTDILDDDIPVVSADDVVIRPYNDETIKIAKYFYDYQAEKEKQQQSIFYYQNTYMQNSGVDYSGDNEKFDVLSILPGTVINVMEDDTLGKVIEVRHDNDIISVYQCLSESLVKKDDVIAQGTIVGKSGSCNLSEDLKDHLHFELFYKGKVVNPEDYYDKKVKEL